MKKSTIISSLLALAAACVFLLHAGFPRLAGPYLGQKPPGTTPEVFAPGIVSTEEANIHSAVSFLPDGKQ